MKPLTRNIIQKKKKVIKKTVLNFEVKKGEQIQKKKSDKFKKSKKIEKIEKSKKWKRLKNNSDVF